MPSVLAALVSESIAFDQFSRRLSVFHLIENANMPQLPGLAPPATVVVIYATEAAPLSFAERVRVVAPNETTAVESRAVVKAPARDPVNGPLSHVSLHLLPGIPLTVYGPHRVFIETGPTAGEGPWEKVAEREIIVRKPPPPTAPH